VRALLRVALLAVVVACGVGRPTPVPPDPRAAVRTELYLGRARAGGAIVDDAAWQAFLSDVVTPRFPDGFTVIDASGQYRGADSDEITHERTEVLVVVHRGDDRAENALRDITAAYRERFGQQDVLRVDTAARVGF
jgi:hypothetical protein